MSQPITALAVNGANPITITNTLTTLQYMPAVPGASIGVTATTPVAGFLAVPGSNRVNGQQLNVRAAGSFKPGADGTSPTFTIGLYYIKNLTIYAATTSNINPVFTSVIAAAGLGIVYSPWKFSCDLNCDNDSGILQGNYTVQADNEAIATGAINAISGVNMNNDQPLAFCVGFTWSQASAGNTTKLYQFDIQA